MQPSDPSVPEADRPRPNGDASPDHAGLGSQTFHDPTGNAGAPDALRDGVVDGGPMQVGRVVSVSGSQVVMLYRPPDGSAAVPDQSLQIGTLLKMENAGTTVYGIVSGLTIPVPDNQAGDQEMRIVELELLGEAEKLADGGHKGFQRGVSLFPSLADPVFTAVRSDLELVYERPEAATVKIGSIHQDRTLPAYVVTDDLLGKHFAILGTTGSGKSCAVALLLRALLNENPNAHVVLLDPHSEYARAFGEAAEVLTPDNLQLPYWLLNFEELSEVILGRDDEQIASVAILNDAIPKAKKQYAKDDADYPITVDTPVPYRLTDLLQLIDDDMGKLDKPEDTAPYLKLKTRLNALRGDKRFAFMFGGLTVRDNMSEILARILRIPVDGKPVTIMDLSGIPSEILNVVVSVLCRLTFDFSLWSERAVPTLLVCEEAHRYAPEDSSLGFEPTKRALSRIAKEGRKYGVSLCVVSQRPSELAVSMLSQCSTIFAMRLSNQRDQDFVRGAMRESASGLLDFLPSLHNAEAIAVGEGVAVPVRLVFDELSPEHRPESGTASFSRSWQEESPDKDFLDDVVGRWRRQRR